MTQSQWIDLDEAAAVLGLTQASVRRRIGKGQLHSRRGEGERLQVRMDFEGEAAALFEAADRLKDERLRDRARALALEAATAATAGTTQANGEHGGEESADAGAVAVPAAVEATLSEADAPADIADAADMAAQLSNNPWIMTSRRPGTDEGTPLDRRRARIAPALLLGRAEADAQRGGETDLTRYQRLAGACLVLSQDQSDAAERRAETMARESARLRRVCGMSWAASAIIAVVLTGVGVKLGFDAKFAQGEAAAQATVAQSERAEAQRVRAALATLRRAAEGNPGEGAMAEVQERGPLRGTR